MKTKPTSRRCIENESSASRLESVASARLLGLLTTICVLTVFGAEFALAESELSLNEAVEIALGANDPTVARFEVRAAALDERAISDSQLPEPQFRFGLMNLPIDSFNFTQEPMTQVQVGFRRSFPRGQTLAINRERKHAEAKEQRAARRLRQFQIAYETRSMWLELYFWIGARQTATESRKAVSELVDVIEASFATGVQSNRDLLSAELELSLIDDRLIEVQRQIEVLRAELQRFIGESPASRELPADFPNLPSPPTRQVIQESLVAHPSVQIQDARITVGDRDIDLAHQKYKAGWSLDIGYGGRGGGRAGFSSAMIVLDTPIFTKNRQDRGLSAARKGQAAARLGRDVKLLDLQRLLNRTYANWVRLGERGELLEETVLDRAKANASAALDSYQNGVADFGELIRARLTALDTELQLHRVKVDQAKAQSGLLFLTMEALP